MSPTLLSKRLKELELAGVIRHIETEGGKSEYRLTEAGEELQPLVVGIGEWGHRWVESRLSLRNLDPSLLMWDIRRNFEPDPPPDHRMTIQFRYRIAAEMLQDWWLVVDRDQTDLCKMDPGYAVDVLIDADLRSMTAVWMGLAPMQEEIAEGRIEIEGPPRLTRQVQTWFKLSIFAKVPRRVP